VTRSAARDDALIHRCLQRAHHQSQVVLGVDLTPRSHPAPRVRRSADPLHRGSSRRRGTHCSRQHPVKRARLRYRGLGDNRRKFLLFEIEHAENSLLVLEVMIQRAAGDSRAARDSLDIGLGVANPGEELARGLDQRGASAWDCSSLRLLTVILLSCQIHTVGMLNTLTYELTGGRLAMKASEFIRRANSRIPPSAESPTSRKAQDQSRCLSTASRQRLRVARCPRRSRAGRRCIALDLMAWATPK